LAGDPAASGSTGAALAFVALALALVGQYMLRQGPPFTWRLAFGAALAYTLAITAFLWLLRLRGRGAVEAAATRAERPADATRRPMTHRPMSLALGLTSLVLTIEIMITLWNRGDYGQHYWDVFALWLVSIALYLMPFVRPWRALSIERAKDAARRMAQPALDAAALLALGLALRVPRLGDLPDVFGGDEGIVGEVARTMSVHAGNMFATMFAYGKMYYLIVGVPVALLGSTAQAVRLPSAIAGALAASTTYLAGRELFGRRVGLAAGFMIAVGHMHIHLSRTAHGQSFDTLLTAAAIFALARGLKRGSLAWMAVAGVVLGLAQYFYVAARLIDVVVAVFFVVLAVADHSLWRRSLGGFVVAFGAAAVTAAPIVVWALRRPGDYLARISSVGFVQTGALALEQETTGAGALRVAVDQVATAVLVPIALPARLFYDARIPMLDILWASLLVLGLALAIARWRDWRYLLLLLFVLGGVAVLALGNLIDGSAYRITVVMPAYAILAAQALVLLVERGAEGLALRPRVIPFAIGAALAVIGVRDVGYYFFDHVPSCRYMERDAPTAAVSMATRYISEEAPDARIYALTEPEFYVGGFPNAKFYTIRDTRHIDDSDTPGPTEEGGEKYIHSVGPEFELEDLLAGVGSDDEVVFIASPGRRDQLREVARKLPGGERVPFFRCGVEIVEIYHIHGVGE